MRNETSAPARRVATAAALGIALALLLAAPARAQIATAILEVQVVGQDGAALPGVTVEIVSVQTGTSRGLRTDSEGLARFAAVQPGAYRVSCTSPGLKSVTDQTLDVRLGQTGRLKVTMSPELSETVRVTAEAPIVDVYKTDASTNIVPEQIEELPVQDRDFQRLAFIAPGVQRERGAFRFVSGGPVIGSSGNASQSTILVDGVDFTDQALGLARARFSQDAIQEFRVINNRFDVEIGGSAGGALSVVTKSGTNQVSGSVFGFYRADSLRARGALETGNADFSRWQGGATVGGPIVKDKSHYFVSLEQISIDDIAPFRPGGVFAGLARDYSVPTRQTLALVSFDDQLNANQTLRAKLVYERYRQDNFRVGGVSDVSFGQQLNRDNWNAALEHAWVMSNGKLNQLRFQIGRRKYDEPTNSNEPTRLYSLGTTYVSGTNTVGNLLGDGDYYGLSDTFYWTARGAGVHNFKAGLSWMRISERSDIPTFENGYFIYAGDPFDPNDPVATAPPPLIYIGGTGSADVTIDTNLIAAFLQDDWQVTPKLLVNLGLRYDLDTDGNNPDFKQTALGIDGRDVDRNNIQPRAGFVFDVAGDGRNVIRGGVGLFTGRYLLVPAFTELQQNGETGWLVQQRLNGLFLGPPFNVPPFILDPDNPTTTGIGLAPDITVIDRKLDAPEATQASAGWTTRLGKTGLYLDLEALYAKGRKEIVVRDVNFDPATPTVRPNPLYNQINTYTNQGRSTYKAAIVSLNGNLPGGHLVTASFTVADKKNVSDDFSPAFPTGYPSNPADIGAEYGRSRADERYRLVLTGIFRLPWDLTLAPIYEYGSGQPWNHILGYDANGDGKNSDRPAGVARNDEDGPPFRQLSLRLTKTIPFRKTQAIAVIVEGFNVLNTVNYDVTSVDNAEFLSGPTPTAPGTPIIANPNFGKYRATLAPREIQVGLRYTF